jgi:pimeloyl-ACP methyl ester carboxylesterase
MAIPPEVQRSLRVPVGPPNAELELWILDPPQTPRATVLVLHGLRDSKAGSMEAAVKIAEEGMRAILVDLRGHGGSSGQWLSYGVREAHDLRQVIDALQAHHEIAGGLGVYGPSYGGAVAHQLAAIDPRIHAVVSVAAMSDFRRRSREARPFGAWIPNAWIDPEIDRVAHLAGFRVEDADVARAAARYDAPALLFHGDADTIIAFAHGRRLQRACAPRGCRLVRLPGVGHRDALVHPLVGPIARAFFLTELRSAALSRR